MDGPAVDPAALPAQHRQVPPGRCGLRDHAQNAAQSETEGHGQKPRPTAWDRDELGLTACRDYCWDSWMKHIESLRKLLDFDFARLLPGHGQRVQLDTSTMKAQRRDFVTHMIIET